MPLSFTSRHLASADFRYTISGRRPSPKIRAILRKLMAQALQDYESAGILVSIGDNVVVVNELGLPQKRMYGFVELMPQVEVTDGKTSYYLQVCFSIHTNNNRIHWRDGSLRATLPHWMMVD